jgi:holo-[acyl-carrier protein] synthase
MSGLTAAMAQDVEDRIEDWIADVVPHPVVPESGGGRPMVRVGIDLTSVDEVAASIARFGDRYVERMFTPHEQAFCRFGDGPEANRPYRVESLAARFAAKEAVLKVLRPPGPRPPWRDIEVFRTDGGWCEVHLSGSAADLAARAGIDRWSVSLTHHEALAAAVVVGVCFAEAPDSTVTAGVDVGAESGRITTGEHDQ